MVCLHSDKGGYVREDDFRNIDCDAQYLFVSGKIIL